MKYIFEGQLGVQVLGSGSKGNALIIYTNNGALLLDAGLSGRELMKRLTDISVDVSQLDGVLLTHEHNDHVRGLKGLIKKCSLTVWANSQTSEYLKSRGYQEMSWAEFDTGSTFPIGSFTVKSFPVPHDAYDPCGFVITSEKVSVGVLTDLGYCTDEVRQRAACCHVLYLEANYDEELLASDPKRPWATKQRIMARHGHLSNLQASELLSGLKGRNAPLRHVFLGHMSEDCNEAELAINQIRQGLNQAGLDHVEIHLTYQSQVSELVIL